MLLEVSLGEALDKLSILEIKLEKILQEDRLKHVRNEIAGFQHLLNFKEKYVLQYKLLILINTKIWDLTNIVKKLTIDDSDYAKIFAEIFELNQSRFRIKNIINMAENGLQEQKSYNEICITINISDLEIFYDRLSLISYLSTQYDKINIITNFEQVKKIFNTPNYFYLDCSDSGVNLSEINVTDVNLEEYNLPTISYISGGLLGDFIHQLSVVNEKYLETGRKGCLYIANIGDKFRLGLETAYSDTYNIIIKQKYIHSYKIYTGESIDINLSTWRNSSLLYRVTWKDIFSNQYSVKWGESPWLSGFDLQDKYKNTVIISYSANRPIKDITNSLLKELKSEILFIGQSINEYTDFVTKFKIDIPYIIVKNLEEMVLIILSCKLFIGNLSSPLTFALAGHKNCIAQLIGKIDDVHMRNLNIYPEYSCIEYNNIDNLNNYICEKIK